MTKMEAISVIARVVFLSFHFFALGFALRSWANQKDSHSDIAQDYREVSIVFLVVIVVIWFLIFFSGLPDTHAM